MTEAISMRLPRDARVAGCHRLAGAEVRPLADPRFEHARRGGRR